MRTTALFSLFLITTACLCFAGQKENVKDLVAKAEAARPEDQPGLYMRAAQAELKNADELYEGGSTGKARAAVNDIVTYSQKAVDAATQSNKKLKNTEIHIRKIAKRLTDIRRNLAFEDQAPVKAAVDRLQNMRTELLSKMFSSKD